MHPAEELSPRRLAPILLGLVGVLSALLTLADKWIGLFLSPYLFASLAYVSLLGLVAWCFFRGFVRHGHHVRLGAYSAVLLFVLLSAAYAFALKATRDPTPVLVEQQLRQADHLLDQGQKDDALLMYRSAFKRAPHSFPVLMRMGAITYGSGDYDRAVRYYLEAVQRAPAESRGRALMDLAQTVWKQGDSQEAIRLYEDAGQAGMARQDPVEWHYRMGWACFDARDYPAAIQHYQAVADAGRQYVAASLYNIACAQAEQVKLTHDPAARKELIQQAVDTLRRAWAATSTPEEVRSLREGLFGTPAQRDPELAPLRNTVEFHALTRELTGA